MLEPLNKKLTTLESALWFALITHGVGLFSMALLLMPGMPGGFASEATRIKYIAQNPYFWAAGWLPWQLSALSDLLIALCLLPFKEIPLYLRLAVIVFTILAIAPDQSGQFFWVRDGSAIAQEAIAKGDLNIYLKFEQPIYMNICGWAALLYSLLAGLWTVALKPILNAPAIFYKFSWSIWGLSLICSILFIASSAIPIPFVVLAVANAIFFPLLILWFAWVIDCLVKLERPVEQWGRQSTWTLPDSATLRKVTQVAGQCCFLKRLCETMTPVPLASDIGAVIYINYLVSADKLAQFVPAPLELQRLGPNGEYALFSILTFQHNNFGPQKPVHFRQLLKVNAVVSNWRIHVIDPVTKLSGIYFLSNITNNILVALGARLLSEGMPMQVAESTELKIENDEYKILFDSGKGTSPDLHAELKLQSNSATTLPPPWSSCFKDFQDFLSYCVPQDRAISSQQYLRRVTFQEIKLDIPLEQCKPLDGTVHSKAVEAIAGQAEALCFVAPSLQFRFNKEHYKLWK